MNLSVLDSSTSPDHFPTVIIRCVRIVHARNAQYFFKALYKKSLWFDLHKLMTLVLQSSYTSLHYILCSCPFSLQSLQLLICLHQPSLSLLVHSILNCICSLCILESHLNCCQLIFQVLRNVSGMRSVINETKGKREWDMISQKWLKTTENYLSIKAGHIIYTLDM